ncbi:hypothetical protein DL767_002129 [Monosporascus sp. MG133]|nr:hypothetical protein DL767_002129 [Monosporascus sp. MG133]
MVGIPEEESYLSCVMPREALKHEFLLDGIFAVAALDIARSSEEPDATKYEHIALEYYNRGSVTFRALLADIPPDTYHLMFIFATAAAVMVLGLPQGTGDSKDEMSAVGRIITLADLFSGTLLIVNAGWDKLVDAPYPFREALSTKVNSLEILDPNCPVERDGLPYRLASLDLLDDEIKMALARLDSVNNELHGPAQVVEEGQDAAEGGARSVHDVYRLAIFWLKENFAERAVKGYFLSFFTLAGQDFAAAMKNAEPVALFILLHWAVELHVAGRDQWWAKGLGRQLVIEISDLLQSSQLVLLPDGRDGIAWHHFVKMAYYVEMLPLLGTR